MKEPYLMPTQEAGRAFVMRHLQGSVVMLNLLRFRETADYAAYLIGPADERWDAVMLVKQNSVNSFLAFESNVEYMKGIGHRTAALEDSRLLPIHETKIG